MNHDRDMTTGNPFILIGTFSFSLIIGNIFQQLYMVVDSMIIGKKIGPLGLAAIGGTEWLIFLVQGFVIGLIQGFSVILGNKYGEKDEQAFEAYYQKSKKICFVLSMILVILLVAISDILLELIGTKEEVFCYAKQYVNTIFMGLPFLIFYQFFAAVLRCRGNSRIYLIAMTVSSVCNIILDILFVSVLNFGIIGAACGTIISEFIVMMICRYHVNKGRKTQRAKSATYKEKDTVKQLMFMGLPMAMQSVITAVGGLIVVNRINQYEITFLTGYTVAGKLYALLEIAASSYGLAVATYVSQNYGANKYQRIKKGVRSSLLIGMITSFLCSYIMICGGKEIMWLFIAPSDMAYEMIEYGYRYLKILAIFFPFLYVLYIIRATLQGINNSMIPMISSFAQLTMRLLCAIILTKFIGSDGIYWGEITAWLFADLILIVSYYYNMHKIGMYRK